MLLCSLLRALLSLCADIFPKYCLPCRDENVRPDRYQKYSVRGPCRKPARPRLHLYSNSPRMPFTPDVTGILFQQMMNFFQQRTNPGISSIAWVWQIMLLWGCIMGIGSPGTAQTNVEPQAPTASETVPQEPSELSLFEDITDGGHSVEEARTHH